MDSFSNVPIVAESDFSLCIAIVKHNYIVNPTWRASGTTYCRGHSLFHFVYVQVLRILIYGYSNQSVPTLDRIVILNGQLTLVGALCCL